MKPNVLLIYTDQQRHDTIRALGADWMKTPHLDRLTEEGTVFTHATTPSPVCMATRWSLHTGQWTTTHGCYSNHHPGQRPTFDLPGLLRDTGYRTGLVGKNHTFLGPEDVDYWQPNPGSPADEDRETRRRYPRLVAEPLPGGMESNPERARTDAAMRFVDAEVSKPWFLWLSYLYPHTPYEAPEPYYSLYQNCDLPEPVLETDGLRQKPFRQRFHQGNTNRVLPFTKAQTRLMRQVYYGMISLIDAEVGRLLAHLETAGRLDDTFLIFTSDHGDYMGDHGLYTKSPAMYDCLVRVPMIFRWPGEIEAGCRDDRLVSGVDLLPTICAAAGADCPQEVQGVDILSTSEVPRDAVFSEYGVPGPAHTQESVSSAGLDAEPFTNRGDPRLPWEGNPVSLAGRIRMVRTHDWKLVEDTAGGELYDLQKDPGELTNLWHDAQLSETRRQLQRRLDSFKRSLPGMEKAE